MGSDVSVVLHADAAVPNAVTASQRHVQESATPTRFGSAAPAPGVVERCPAIRIIESNAARRLAGDSSAASMASTADLHPLDQPILLIRSCDGLDAFTKSRTYVPVLRAIHAYLDQHERRDVTQHNVKPSFSSSTASNAVPPRRPVCPIGLIFDRSLVLGQRLGNADARAACAQYLKLFLVHLIAALEFVREPDDAAHTRWPSSPCVLAAREASTGATASTQLPPRLSVLYLDMRANAVDDAAAKWFASGVLLRAVRRARPFMLVSARGEAAAGTVGSSGANSGGGGDAFMNLYSPDVKADMVWASLQHFLLTENPRLTLEGAQALLDELLATDATREVLLRQQGFDPRAQRAQAVTQALTCGQLQPRPDAQLLPQLVLVDLDHNHNKNDDVVSTVGVSQVLGDPLERSSAAVSTVPSSSVAHKAEGGSPLLNTVSTMGGSLPPSPQNCAPEPTARGAASPAASTPADSMSAVNTVSAAPQSEQAATTTPQQPPPVRRTPPQHTQRRARSPNLKAVLMAQQSRKTTARVHPQQQQPLAEAPLSPPHPPPQQRVATAPQPDPIVSDPAPSHSPEMGFVSPPRSSTPRAQNAAVDSPALPQLQRPTTPPVTPPRAVVHNGNNNNNEKESSAVTPSPQRREPEPTHTPAELPVAAPSAAVAKSPVRKAQTPNKKRPPPPTTPPPQGQQQQQQQVRADGVKAPKMPRPTSPRAGRGIIGVATAKATPNVPQPTQPKRKPDEAAPASTIAAGGDGNEKEHVGVPSPAAAAAAVVEVVKEEPTAAAERRGSGSSILQGFVKLPGEESAAPASSLASPPVQSVAEHEGTGDNGEISSSAPRPSHTQQQQQQRHAPSARSPRQPCATSARKPRRSSAAGEKAAPSSTSSGRPFTTTAPPQLSATSRRGLNGRVVSPQIPLMQQQQEQQQQQHRDPSPRGRVQRAMVTAAALDDVPDAVVRGHSARRPRAVSPRPDVRCHTPTPPASARWVEAAEQQLPSPTHAAYFHSPVRPEALELAAVQALLAEMRAPEIVADARGRPSVPLVVSPRGPRRSSRVEEPVAEVEEVAAAAAVEEEAEQQQQRQQRSASEEPWLDHAHPVDSLPPPPPQALLSHRGRRSGGMPDGTTPGSGGRRRRRDFDIAALDPPEPQFAAAAAKVAPAVWEAGVMKRHASPAQAAARRTTTPLRSARTRGRATTSTSYDGVPPRTDSPRQRDNVAAAKAAYEAATLAEARAKAQQELRAQKRAAAFFRQQQQMTKLRDERSLRVDGEVQSDPRTPPTAPLDRDDDGGGDATPSPAPNRPNGVGTPPSQQTPLGKGGLAQQHQQQTRGAAAAAAAAGAPVVNSAAPRSVFARRRLSTAAPPHIPPGHTTTSQLRQVTSQRTRRVSEVEAEITGYYANRATPRRDFRGAAAMASMALRQPTRDELVLVQLQQQQANERRHSLGAMRNNYNSSSARMYSDHRRASAAETAAYDDAEGGGHDVSNPAWKSSQQQQQRGAPATSQWTPAYHHRHNLRSPRDVPNGVRHSSGSDDEEGEEETGSEAPSLSPWGTADYQGSAPRVDERNGVPPAPPSAAKVNENGVELVHQALRTKRRPYY